jgi:hypothetical protein
MWFGFKYQLIERNFNKPEHSPLQNDHKPNEIDRQ